MKTLIDKLEKEQQLSKEEICNLIDNISCSDTAYLFERARAVTEKYYGKKIFVRGLIEFTNQCKNDCYYCGIRKSNHHVVRYHLSEEQIYGCCDTGYRLGFRTFVLQGGEDLSYRDDKMVKMIQTIKQHYPDCAITLSIGEKSRESYLRYFEAGADRFLLRHETADKEHYAKLHPQSMSSENRMRCLHYLKEIGYQTGTGFMVGSPFQTTECLAEDLLFIRAFQPKMVGIGPFIPHHETPFAREHAGTMQQTLLLLAMIRLLVPRVLLPATTALGTIDAEGREKGILSGANVIMPNLSPLDVRKKYMIYDNKISTGDEAAESFYQIKEKIKHIGYDIVIDRGDAL